MLERQVPGGWGQYHTIQVAPEILKGLYQITKGLKLPHSSPHGNQSVEVLDLCLNPRLTQRSPNLVFPSFPQWRVSGVHKSVNTTLNRRSLPLFFLWFGVSLFQD